MALVYGAIVYNTAQYTLLYVEKWEYYFNAA